MQEGSNRSEGLEAARIVYNKSVVDTIGSCACAPINAEGNPRHKVAKCKPTSVPCRSVLRPRPSLCSGEAPSVGHVAALLPVAAKPLQHRKTKAALSQEYLSFQNTKK